MGAGAEGHAGGAAEDALTAESSPARRWLRRHRLHLALGGVVLATCVAFVLAHQTFPGFWAEFLLVLGGAGLAAAVSVGGVEVLLKWQEQAAWGEVREQVLNALRRALEGVAATMLHAVRPDGRSHRAFVLHARRHPDVDALARLVELVSEHAEMMSPFADAVDLRPRSAVDRLMTVLLRAPFTHVSEDVILAVGYVERSLGHWEGWVRDVDAQDDPDEAARLRRFAQGAAVGFAEAVVAAYEAVVAEMKIVRADEDLAPPPEPDIAEGA
jgi:hypothetical protein